MNRVSLAAMRTLLANTVCAEKRAVHRLGGVQLFPHQLDAVRRVRDAIARFGGALLADDVGAGKTFVALAIASSYSHPIVLAPAALRSMWTRAMAQTSTAMPFMSLESLGRGRPPPAGHDLVIVDEAHHLRNPATQRYAATQRAVTGAHVLLASATPVHNVARDLDSLLALFLRADAADLDGEARAQVIVRSASLTPAAAAVPGAHHDARSDATPAVHVHDPLPVADDERMIAAIQRLPSPVRPSDGGDAPALFRIALLRAWCSSVAAIDAMLVRATHAAAALTDALRTGRTLTRGELGAWSLEDGQLAFAELFGAPSAPNDARSALRDAESHLESLRDLRRTVGACNAIDTERARLLRAIVDAHSATPVLACAQYAATVSMLWRQLRGSPGVALLTSRGARIASGPIARDDALRRFAPRAHGVRAPHARERITLLLATDLVSEGLNLQDAGVVVHLDLPWTAARLAQRVGRVARIGSLHETVHVYAMQPPRAAAALLALERRIRTKRALGEQLVGGGGRMAALLGGRHHGHASDAEARARVVATLEAYAVKGDCVMGNGPSQNGVMGGQNGETTLRNECAICAVNAAETGWIALIGATGSAQPRLLARLGSRGATTEPRIVARAVKQLADATEETQPWGAENALSQLMRWLSNERARELSSANRRNAARVHGRAIATTVGSVSAASAHERATVAVQAHRELSELASQGHPIVNRQSSIAPLDRQSSIAPLVALVLFSPCDQTRNSL